MWVHGTSIIQYPLFQRAVLFKLTIALIWPPSPSGLLPCSLILFESRDAQNWTDLKYYICLDIYVHFLGPKNICNNVFSSVTWEVRIISPFVQELPQKVHWHVQGGSEPHLDWHYLPLDYALRPLITCVTPTSEPRRWISRVTPCFHWYVITLP